MTLAFAPPALLIAAALSQTGVDPRLLFLDPLEAAEIAEPCCAAHLGAVTNIGVLATTAAAVAAALAAMGAPRGAPARAGAGAAAVLFALIAVDDLFMLHERVFPALGVSEVAFQALYIVGGIAVFTLHRAWMEPTLTPLLVCALTLLGVSAGLDMAMETARGLAPAELQSRVATNRTKTLYTAVEDSAKFTGLWVASVCALSASSRRLGRR